MTSDDTELGSTKSVDGNGVDRPAAVSAGRRAAVRSAVVAALLVVAGISYTVLADPVVPLVTRVAAPPTKPSSTAPAVAATFTPSPVDTAAVPSDGPTSATSGGGTPARPTPVTAGPTNRTDPATDATRPPALAVAPTLLEVVRADNYGISVSWNDNSTGEFRFDVEVNGQIVGTARPNGYVYYYMYPIIDEVSVEYCFRVRAVGPWGVNQTEQPTEWTGRACAYSVANPAMPTDVRVIPISDTAIRITWVDNSAIETGFAIVRTPGLIEQTVGPNVTSLIWDGLSPGTQYCFFVRAANSINYANLGDCAWTRPAPGDW